MRAGLPTVFVGKTVEACGLGGGVLSGDMALSSREYTSSSMFCRTSQ